MSNYNIDIPNLSIDNLFIRHSNVDPMVNYYHEYKINGISYYVPYYGDTIVFDLIHKDIIRSKEPIIKIQDKQKKI